MTRYATRAAIVNNPQDNPRPNVPHFGTHEDYRFEVFEADAWRNTGVLDASGQPIWATDKGPLGFGGAQ